MNDASTEHRANAGGRRLPKTFEEACDILGGNSPLVIMARQAQADCGLLPFLKLRVICAVLNGEWNPASTELDRSWCPEFRIIGLVYQTSRVSADFPKDNNVCFFYFKSMDLSRYCAEQFIDLWETFYKSVGVV